MRADQPTAHDATLDRAEVERFARLAGEWWDPAGKFRPLHKLGPARLTFLRDELTQHFNRDSNGHRPLAGLRLVDVGCGGGLICEPLARLGAMVTGIDPAPENIAAAERHAAGQGLAIDYRSCRIEDLAAGAGTFDAVLCLEVVEHVPNPGAFLLSCRQILRPGGLLLLSTINRTLKSYALAIIGAEYILRWLPVGTHQWDRFLTPAETSGLLTRAGFGETRFKGLVYQPLTDAWALSDDTDVNYLAAAALPA